MDVSVSLLEHSDKFLQVYKKGLEDGRKSLRRLQWEKAQGYEPELLRDDDGNFVTDVNGKPILSRPATLPDTTMLIWLGKQLLGQRDRQELSVDHQVTVKLDDQQMSQIRAERQAGMAELEAMSRRYLHPGQDVVDGELVE
uniref:Uncharacterized protein n=1 Tax=viral metagenome TaxID=1070528 RepID=A0A6H1ZGQ1_9ZZZZ